jgi:DsbC/DsbD-like thiol-disulfide interchange protein
MKRIVVSIVGLMTVTAALAQASEKSDPVHWSYKVEKRVGQTINIHITATIDPGWHIYSQIQPKEAICQPTKIVFVKSPLLNLSGTPKETGKKETYTDPTAGIVQYQYGGAVDFVETIVLKATVKTMITGTITYQACTAEMCLPPKTVSFSVELQ